MQPRYLGVMETVWAPVSSFLNEFYGKQQPAVQNNNRPADAINTASNTFRTMFVELQLLQPRK
jgi:hypothetical protein